MPAATPTHGHDVFQAIAHPTRRRLLHLLVAEEMPIASISQRLPVSRTAVNKHLHVLADARLVTFRKVGRETRYRSHPAPLREVKEWIAEYERFWDDKMAALKEYVETGDSHEGSSTGAD